MLKLNLKLDKYFILGGNDFQQSMRDLALTFSPLTSRQEKYVGSRQCQADLSVILRKSAPNCCFVQLYDCKPFPAATKKSECPPPLIQTARQLAVSGAVSTISELIELLKLGDCDISCLRDSTVDQSQCEDWLP